MNNLVENIVAALVISCLFCLMTGKLLGAIQQSGYKNKIFWRWLKRKDNLQFNRLSVLALCLALSTAVVSLCFSFLGSGWANLISAVPFFTLLLVYSIADGKYALKVSTNVTGRIKRLFGVYYFVTALVSYILIAVLEFLSLWNGSSLYALIAYVPVAVMPLLLPALLCFANLLTCGFENGRNKRYLKRAGQVLDEREIIRVAVVGSYGKTSVKNILKTLLSEKYSVVETPASYNTPLGIAKTVCSPEFDNKQVFIAEMGARNAGDIGELCSLVHPDYAVFTGVCEQHIATFGSLENVLAEKSEILRCRAKKVVCGESLRGQIPEEGVIFSGESMVKNLRLSGTKTAFTLSLNGREIEVETSLLGKISAENIAMAATLCLEMGMTAEELSAGIAKLQPVSHRLQLIESNGAYILDDGYNCNIRGAQAAIDTLALFAGRKCIVTPGIVEGGILEETLNVRLGKAIAEKDLDNVILVGDTLVGAVKDGYEAEGGDLKKLTVVRSLEGAQTLLGKWVQTGDCILFLNDLPDVY